VRYTRCESRATAAKLRPHIFDGTEGILFPVAPDASSWTRIHEAWEMFSRYVTEALAPPLTDRDTRVRDDPEWLEAAARYVAVRTAYDELSAKYDEAKTRLIGLAAHAREQGGGVSVTRTGKRGSIDYKRIPKLARVNLEQYRGASREEARVVIHPLAESQCETRLTA